MHQSYLCSETVNGMFVVCITVKIIMKEIINYFLWNNTQKNVPTLMEQKYMGMYNAVINNAIYYIMHFHT